MKVDFVNFNYVDPEIKQEWRSAIADVIDSGVFIGGSHVSFFEHEMAKHLGVKNAIGISNGYDGLELALLALGIGSEDYIAVPAHTFIATWNSIISVGATPVGIDVNLDGQIDVDALKSAIETKKISCVIPVHMHGHASQISEIVALCKSNGVSVIEDASQAHFAIENNRLVGTQSDIAVFSLYPTKNLGALGDAGVLVTNSDALAEKVRSLSNYGSLTTDKYFHDRLGFNKRLDTMQAAILNVNLRRIDSWNQKRRQLAVIYSTAFQKMGIKFIRGTQGSVWHHFCIFVENRGKVRDYLHENSIGTEIHYPQLAAHEAERFMGLKPNPYPTAERISNTTLSLPISQFHNSEMIEYVIDVMIRAQNIGIIK